MRRIYGCPEIFLQSLATPTATLPDFLIDPVNVDTKFEVRSFTRS